MTFAAEDARRKRNLARARPLRTAHHGMHRGVCGAAEIAWGNP
ncbi:MAG: hypothetical protein PUJ38_01485 [Prevotella stercorea]|nr:hypothetical protein [Leyella stercorea]